MRLGKFNTLLWLVIRDFNKILSNKEKIGHQLGNARMLSFKKFLDNGGLIDLKTI